MDQEFENESFENENPQQQPDKPEENAEKSQPQQPDTVEVLKSEEKNIAMLCHILGIFTNFLGPLIIWLIKKNESKYIDEQGKEALNFQITVLMAYFVSGLLAFICVGGLLAIAVWVCNIVFSVMAAIAANKGEHYRYPVSIRLVNKQVA